MLIATLPSRACVSGARPFERADGARNGIALLNRAHGLTGENAPDHFARNGCSTDAARALRFNHRRRINRPVHCKNETAPRPPIIWRAEVAGSARARCFLPSLTF